MCMYVPIVEEFKKRLLATMSCDWTHGWIFKDSRIKDFDLGLLCPFLCSTYTYLSLGSLEQLLKHTINEVRLTNLMPI